jgi:hypothetical protein
MPMLLSVGKTSDVMLSFYFNPRVAHIIVHRRGEKQMQTITLTWSELRDLATKADELLTRNGWPK